MKNVKYYAYIKNRKVLSNYIQYSCFLQQCNNGKAHVSKIDLR